MTLRYTMRRLYEGRSEHARWFLYGLLIFDFASLLFIIATSFLPRTQLIRGLDLFVGVIFLVEFAARFAAARRPFREIFRLTTWTDVAAIISLLASATGEAAGFLRSLRTLRLLRAFRVVELLRKESVIFRRHEEIVAAVANLSVFIFVMTGGLRNPASRQSEHRQLCGRPILHGDCFNDHRLRRHHFAGNGRPVDNCRYHDFRRNPLPQSRPRPFQSDQGALYLQGLRPAKA